MSENGCKEIATIIWGFAASDVLPAVPWKTEVISWNVSVDKMIWKILSLYYLSYDNQYDVMNNHVIQQTILSTKSC